MNSTIEQRGPVCECNDPRCFLPIPLSWTGFADKHGNTLGTIIVSDECPTDRTYLTPVDQCDGYGIYSLDPIAQPLDAEDDPVLLDDPAAND